VIFHASGSTGLGVFEAARQTDKLAIGVDADQYAEAPGHVLTSMVKGVDAVVFDQIEKARRGTFHGGVQEYGLAGKGCLVHIRCAQPRAHPRQRARARRGDSRGDHRGAHRRPGNAMTGSGAISGAPAVRMTGIAKRFGDCHAVRDASLEVMPGEIHALVGENGAGKSTMMRVLAGIYPPDAGTVEVSGRDITGWSAAQAIDAGVGMVHQHFMLVPTLTIAEKRHPRPRAHARPRDRHGPRHRASTRA